MRTPTLRLFGVLLAVLLVFIAAATSAAAHASGVPVADLPAIATAVEYAKGFTGHADGLGALASGFAPKLAFAPLLMRFTPRFEGENDKGGDTPPRQLTRDEVQAIAESTLKRAGADTSAGTISLFTQKLEEVADLRRQLAASQAETQSARVPDGAVVLTGEEAKRYAELQAREGWKDAPLAKAAEALATGETAAKTLQTQEAQAKRRKAVEGVINYDVLAKLAGADALDFEPEGEGKDKRVYVKYADAQGAEKRELAADYFGREFPEVKDVLFKAGTTGAPNGAPNGAAQAPRAGTFVGQPASGGASGGPSGGGEFDVDSWVKQRNDARTGQKPAQQPTQTATA